MVVTTPCYGACTIGYAQSFFGASKDRSLLSIVCGVQPNSSLLPTSFNECLAACLNARDRGQATHMAMIHSDISAQGGWLDALWGEMWSHGADWIGAVVPIKGPTGRTSTGIGRVDDRWDCHRCLMLDDLARLPATFGPEHVCGKGEVLLANTGCWMADLRHPFFDWFATVGCDGCSGFNIRSRLTQKLDPDGIFAWAVDTRSEDWELSHEMAAFGLKYMITQRVKLWHEGGGRWPNHREDDLGHLQGRLRDLQADRDGRAAAGGAELT